MTHVDVTVPDGLLAALKKAPHEGGCGAPSRGSHPLVPAESAVDGTGCGNRRHDSCGLAVASAASPTFVPVQVAAGVGAPAMEIGFSTGELLHVRSGA